MDYVSVKACAKLNLFLDITGKRDDGYHLLRSVMQSIDYFDYVTIQKSDALSVTCSEPTLNGENNIAYKAAELFFKEIGQPPEVSIFIDKRIPMEAGLAGGSADAAAVLFGLNELFETGFSRGKLCEIGAHCGADVPFSLTGSTMLCEGIGDSFTELSPLPDCWILVAKPMIGMSTKESYRIFDEHEQNSVEHGEFSILEKSLSEQDLSGICQNMANVLEGTVPGAEVQTLRSFLLENGALGSSMTGSGTAVFGIFDEEEKAVAAKTVLSERYPIVFLARPTSYGVDFDKSAPVLDRLRALSLPYEKIDHPAVYTMEEMDSLGIFTKGTVGKNLFLRDSKGRRHFLIFICGDKKADLHAIEEKIGMKHCSFGSAERLSRYLGLTKGSVSPMGVINDRDAAVEFVFDRDFEPDTVVGVHPNQNTSTLWLRFSDIVKLVQSNGNSVRFVDI